MLAISAELVRDINLVVAGLNGSSSPANFIQVGGTLFFSATDPVRGTELFKSDGTSAGTVLLKDINPV